MRAPSDPVQAGGAPGTVVRVDFFGGLGCRVDHGSAAFGEDAREPVTVTRPNLVIGVMVVATFVMILNETIVSIALPDLADVMGVSATTIQWLVSGFLVTMAVVIPMTGFILDRTSPRVIFLAAMTSFALGCLVCGLAQNFAMLLVGRMVQACGTAVMIPLVMTTVMRLVPRDRRGAMMGTISIVIAVAPAIGPTVGGAILAGLSWRWMFLLPLILGAVVLAFGAVRLKVPARIKAVTLDAPSVVLSAVGFAALLYGLSTIGGGDGPVPSWLLIVAGAAVLAVFVWRQLRLGRTGNPLLNLATFGYVRFVVPVALSLLVFMALLGAGAVLLPIYLQAVLGHGTFVAGLALLPGGIAMALVSRPAGRLYDRHGARPLVIPGAVGMTAALWIFTLLGGDAPLAAVIGGDVLLMASLGTMMTPLLAESLGALPDPLYSHGSAALNTLQQVAGAIGSALFVSIATAASATHAGLPDAGGLATAFGVAGCVGFAAIVVSLLLKGPAPAPEAHSRTAHA